MGAAIDGAVERSLPDRPAVARSAATAATDRSALRRFAQFLDAQPPRPAAVDELTDWQGGRRGLGC